MLLVLLLMLLTLIHNTASKTCVLIEIGATNTTNDCVVSEYVTSGKQSRWRWWWWWDFDHWEKNGNIIKMVAANYHENKGDNELTNIHNIYYLQKLWFNWVFSNFAKNSPGFLVFQQTNTVSPKKWKKIIEIKSEILNC